MTDSGSAITYDAEKKPGIANLLEIYAALTGREPDAVAKAFSGKKYSDFKQSLAEFTGDYFADFRAKKKALLGKPAALTALLKEGSRDAAATAEKKMAEVKKKIGISL